MLFNSDLLPPRVLACPRMARTEATKMYEIYILLLTHPKTSNVTKSFPKVKLKKERSN